jgi:MFS family permease
VSTPVARVRLLADGPVGAGHRSSSRDRHHYFGTGLFLPFEIIYLHEVRGFTTATAGLVLAAVMLTAAVVPLAAGALLDRFRAKPILITGNLVSALGYAGLAFVDRPWHGFVCSGVAGAGFAVAGNAHQLLSLTLVTPEQRAASIALPESRAISAWAPERRSRASSSLPPRAHMYPVAGQAGRAVTINPTAPR